MNILIAASYATPQSGNFIASMLELGLMLRQQGNDLFFVLPKCENTLRKNSWVSWLQENDFMVYLVDKSASDNQQLADLLTIIKKHDIHILHTHFGMYERLITHSRRYLPVKVIVHHHSGLSSKESVQKQKLRNITKSIRYRLLNINLICVNENIAHTYPFTNRRYIPNGLSLLRHVKHSRTREECRNEFTFSENAKICLLLGWDIHVKGLDIALKAISLLHQTNPDIILAIVGFGAVPTEKVLNNIKTYTGIDPNVPWIRFLPDTEDMFAYHRMADVYLSASRTEGFSYGVLETISQNTPVVVSDIEGTRWAHVYDHAFPYPVEDSVACSQAIEKALCVPKVSDNSHKILEEFRIGKWCKDVIDFYHSI